MKQKPIF